MLFNEFRSKKSVQLVSWSLVISLLVFPWVSLVTPFGVVHAEEILPDQQQSSSSSAILEEENGSVSFTPTPTPAVGAEEADSQTQDSNHAQAAASAQTSDGLGEVDAQAGSNLTVDLDNQATVDSTVEASAVTGGNQANSGDQAETDIDTGDAQVAGEILEEINTNITTVDGTLTYESIQDGEGDLVIGSVDLVSTKSASLSLPDTIEEPTPSPELSEEDPPSPPNELSALGTTISNIADVSTQILVQAISGSNQANANQGDAQVTTGDAEVFASIIQVVNTNIVAQNALLAIVNIFGELVGDIVFPDIFGYQIFSQSETHLDLVPESDNEITQFSADNQLNLNENVTLLADTGNNQAGGNLCDSSISTGDASVKASVINIGNTNIFTQNWGGLIINDFGTWQGSLISTTMSDFSDTAAFPSLQSSSTTTVNANNSADVSHSVNLSAVTGLNSASNNAGNASIQTGNAKASLSLVSFINTNIIARRATVAVINIFGKMVGNLFFGGTPVVSSPEEETPTQPEQSANQQESVLGVTINNQATINKNIQAVANTGGNIIGDPDLVLYKGHNVESGVVWPGEKFAYYLSVENQGYSEAYDVVIEDTFPEHFIYEYDTSGLPLSIFGSTYRWRVGTLWPGQKVEFWVYGHTVSDIVEGKYSLANSAIVSTSSRDSNQDNNIGGTDLTLAAEAVLYISKWHDRANGVYNGEIVTYWVKVENRGNGITDSWGILDTLPTDFTYLANFTTRDGNYWSDPAGINPLYWSVGDLRPGNSFLISYRVRVGGSVTPGTYYNKSALVGGPQDIRASSAIEVSVGVDVLGGIILAGNDKRGQILPATGADNDLLGLVGLLLSSLGILLQKSSKKLYFKVKK